MADLTQLSDDELMALYQGGQQTQPDLQSMSDDELMAMYQQGQPQTQQDPSLMQRGANLVEGLKRGATFGFGDEIQAGIAGSVAALSPDLTFKQGYDQALQDFRGQYEQAREQTPWTTGAGEFVGAVGTGIAGTPKAVAKGLTNVAGRGFLPRAATSSGVGAASGGVYGFGTGEGGTDQRLSEAAKMGAFGAGGGFVGSGVGTLIGKAAKSPISQRVSNFIARKNAARKPSQLEPKKFAQEIAERQDEIAPIVGGQNAYGKVAKQLKQDLGADYEDALRAYKDGDISLIELNGSRSRTLAQGAAQYPEGKARAQEFFGEKVGGSYERVLKSIKDNVSGVDAYFTTADDLVNAGRAKSAPLYDDAFEKGANITDSRLIKFTNDKRVMDAVDKAKNEYGVRLEAAANSLETLDGVKKVLYDIESEARRAGKDNLAGSYKNLRQELVSILDDSVPEYKLARATSGDYLSINEAMENGRKILKTDSEITENTFKKLNDNEKQAFQIGLGKAIRDEVGKIKDGSNPYDRILGSPEKRKRIQAVLSPRQYKNLDLELKAEDRLFKMRNEIIGGSPTAGKQEAKNMISSGVGAVDDMAQIPRKTMVSGLKMFFDGLDDKTAGKVSEILYETDPTKKLVILDRLKGAKDFTPSEKAMVKKAYFEAADNFDVLRTNSIVAGGVTPAIIEGNE